MVQEVQDAIAGKPSILDAGLTVDQHGACLLAERDVASLQAREADGQWWICHQPSHDVELRDVEERAHPIGLEPGLERLLGECEGLVSRRER